MPHARYVLCDVFTDRPFAGNQLAVFPDATAIPEADLQRIALEFNFSEVTFVYAPQGDGDARMRIFTPATELPFAGHPTLGTAAVLAAERDTGKLALATGAGTIPVDVDRTRDQTYRGWMRQPVPKHDPFPRTDELFAALGIDHSKLPIDVYDIGIQHLYVTLADEAAVTDLSPDLRPIAGLEPGISCVAGKGSTWKTRVFFADGAGIGEDPATGSAAGPLLYHLIRHGVVEPGTTIEISQGAEVGRPSTLFARTEPTLDSIDVGGDVVIVGDGQLSW